MLRTESNLEVSPPDPPFWTKTSWLQLGYGVWVNMTVMGIGLAFGFPAVTIPQLREESSGIKTTLRDEAWIASVLTLSSPIGSLLCGILMDRYGRGLVLVLCEIPMCVGWFYTGFSKTAKDIIIGRVIAGLGLGMAITAPRAYINEITLPNMRGVIGALPNLFISLGLTMQAGLGSFLKWTTVCYICGCYTIIMMASNIFLPDTPYFLLMKKSPTTVSTFKVNLRKFRSSRFNVDAELEALYDFRKENNIRSLSLKDQMKALFKTSSCKPYGIVSLYIFFTQLAGVNVIIMWAVEMLETANTSVDAHLGNFILALTRIVFGLLTSILLYRVGRRVMALVSAIGVGVVSIGLCIFLYVIKEKTVFPMFIYMAYIAFATLGYYTLPFLMMFELLPLQIRGLLSGICISQMNLLMFAMNNCYPFIREKLGLANTMAMFGVFSLLGALILYFILPETKGLTLQEIEEFFNTRRPTLISQRQVMSEQLNTLSRMNLGASKSNLNLKKGMKSKESMAKTSDKNQKDPKEKALKAKDLEEKEKHSAGYSKDIQKEDKTSENNEQKLKDNKDFIDDENILKDNEKNVKEKGKDMMDNQKLVVNDNGSKQNEQNLKEKGKDLTGNENLVVSEKSSKDNEQNLKDRSKDLMDNKNLVVNEKGAKDNDQNLEGKEKRLVDEESDLKNEKMNLKDNTTKDLKDEKALTEEKKFKIEEKHMIGTESDLNDEKNDLNDVELVSKEDKMNVEEKGEEKKATDKEEGSKDKKVSVETENDTKDTKSIDSKDSKDSKKSKKAATAVIFKKNDD